MAGHRATLVAVLVSVAAVASIGLGVVGFVSSGDADATAGATLQGGCDYEALYDQVVDSVVSVVSAAGGGSGFVYRTAQDGTSGLIVTNAHVVDDASTVGVEFRRGDRRSGTVVGTDRLTDLAVVRVRDVPSYVAVLPVADSIPDPGEDVAAFGHPFGLDETITSGIVSGVNRSLPTTAGFTVPEVIQTDAAISPGNSGGPLVTCDGTAVGVNTAGIAATGAENIGFAVPVTVVSEVVPELIAQGDASHAYLGVGVAPVTPAIAEANGLEETDGVYVTAVGPGTPADGALRGATGSANVSGGLVPVGGDVIVAIDGRPIQSPQDLSSYLLLETEPGRTVTVTVVRDGDRVDVPVIVGERPEVGTS